MQGIKSSELPEARLERRTKWLLHLKPELETVSTILFAPHPISNGGCLSEILIRICQFPQMIEKAMQAGAGSCPEASLRNRLNVIHDVLVSSKDELRAYRQSRRRESSVGGPLEDLAAQSRSDSARAAAARLREALKTVESLLRHKTFEPFDFSKSTEAGGESELDHSEERRSSGDARGREGRSSEARQESSSRRTASTAADQFQDGSDHYTLLPDEERVKEGESDKENDRNDIDRKKRSSSSGAEERISSRRRRSSDAGKTRSRTLPAGKEVGGRRITDVRSSRSGPINKKDLQKGSLRTEDLEKDDLECLKVIFKEIEELKSLTVQFAKSVEGAGHDLDALECSSHTALLETTKAKTELTQAAEIKRKSNLQTIILMLSLSVLMIIALYIATFT